MTAPELAACARLNGVELRLDGNEIALDSGREPPAWLLDTLKRQAPELRDWLKQRRPDLPLLERPCAMRIDSSPLGQRVWLCTDKSVVRQIKRDFPDFIVLTVQEVEELGLDGIRQRYSAAPRATGAKVRRAAPGGAERPSRFRRRAAGDDQAGGAGGKDRG